MHIKLSSSTSLLPHFAYGLLLMAGSAHAATPDTPAAVPTEARIARVENGLRYPVAVRGMPAPAMRLSERMRTLHVPGVSVALIDGGRIAWTRAWGVADAASGRMLTPDTLFQVASLSKPVTAVMTMRLAARGRIGLDQDVNAGLRAWRLPASSFTAQRPVTVRALLSHTAGLPDYGLMGYGAGDPRPSLLQVLQGSSPATNPAAQVQSVPGSRYAYSSLGYAVLQQYLCDVTGRPFDTLARETVLEPLGMRDALFAQDLPPELAARAAVGHELDGTPVAGGWRRYPELAAAGLWASASDLARFVIALQAAASGQDERFLTRARARELMTPVLGDYGLGFELDHQGSDEVFHHSGSNAGYKALLFAYPERGQGAVILTNGDAGWTLIEELMRSLASEYGWHDWRPVERTAAPSGTVPYDLLEGAYAVANVTLRVERRGKGLYLSGPPLGPEPVELIPSGDYDYFIREKNATLHFDANGGAKVETILFVDGRPRPGKRVADPSQAAGPGRAARAPAPGR